MAHQVLMPVEKHLSSFVRNGRYIRVQLMYGNAISIMLSKLFDYGSAVRKVMYTTNAVESINSSFRKVTKKGHSPAKTPC